MRLGRYTTVKIVGPVSVVRSGRRRFSHVMPGIVRGDSQFPARVTVILVNARTQEVGEEVQVDLMQHGKALFYDTVEWDSINS